MKFEIIYTNNKAITTFKDDIGGYEILKAFTEIIDYIDLDNLKYIIFDYSNITSFTIPPDYIKTLKTFTQFPS
ncbi:hypothetical protein [Urechidicola croceus]|uniref:DUF4325 domain-containing protein n=1 Tax=Urechidicola croceus TaxID=1850246 RepID=A0A1D8P5X6_9FLAO|nr:hypothetical protein [Urechidicola croceus]AOW19971.1 hypothetical protein LPB138_04405 [Urechidicola croceus]